MPSVYGLILNRVRFKDMQYWKGLYYFKSKGASKQHLKLYFACCWLDYTFSGKRKCMTLWKAVKKMKQKELSDNINHIYVYDRLSDSLVNKLNVNAH